MTTPTDQAIAALEEGANLIDEFTQKHGAGFYEEAAKMRAAATALRAPIAGDAAAEGELLPIWLDGGYGRRMTDTALKYLEEYIYNPNPDECADEELTERERQMIHDFIYGMMDNEHCGGILQEMARAAAPPPAAGGMKADWTVKEALEQMTAQFWKYEKLHYAKNTGEGNEKAAVNRHFALMGDAALAKLSPDALATQPEARPEVDYTQTVEGILVHLAKRNCEARQFGWDKINQKSWIDGAASELMGYLATRGTP